MWCAMVGHSSSEMTRLYSNVDHDEKARAHTSAFGDVLNLAVGLKGGTDDESHQNWVELRTGEKKNP